MRLDGGGSVPGGPRTGSRESVDAKPLFDLLEELEHRSPTRVRPWHARIEACWLRWVLGSPGNALWVLIGAVLAALYGQYGEKGEGLLVGTIACAVLAFFSTVVGETARKFEAEERKLVAEEQRIERFRSALDSLRNALSGIENLLSYGDYRATILLPIFEPKERHLRPFVRTKRHQIDPACAWPSIDDSAGTAGCEGAAGEAWHHPDRIVEYSSPVSYDQDPKRYAAMMGNLSDAFLKRVRRKSRYYLAAALQDNDGPCAVLTVDTKDNGCLAQHPLIPSDPKLPPEVLQRHGEKRLFIEWFAEHLAKHVLPEVYEAARQVG